MEERRRYALMGERIGNGQNEATQIGMEENNESGMTPHFKHLMGNQIVNSNEIILGIKKRH